MAIGFAAYMVPLLLLFFGAAFLHPFFIHLRQSWKEPVAAVVYLLGLMGLAFLPVRINKWAAGAGFVASYAALFLMMGAGINFLLWSVIGNLVCFFVGLFLNPLFSTAEQCAEVCARRGQGKE